MLEWKTSEEAKTVHKELYDLVDPDDPRSDTLLTVIIKAVFSDKELTNKNARWAQSVVETIFDTNYLSPKIDADIIESWTEALTDTATDTEMELVNILVYVLDRKSTRLNSSHVEISYAVFCLKKKKIQWALFLQAYRLTIRSIPGK